MKRSPAKNTKRLTEEDFKSSPPFQGGVAEGRGGYSDPKTKKFPAGDDKLNNRDYLSPRRKTLRNGLTPAEAKLWLFLKNDKLKGRKFRRQHSIENYILDFYCPSEKLAIELDGEIHFNDQAREADSVRTAYLDKLGIKVLRFENKLVFDDLEWILSVIENNFDRDKK
ncbi:MAG TPA: endonuclease domain-containing protein [Pyrinomonadaceae bacterium]|jgi:very-short-patch-repair endonuclease|nr:endonuclease domain-containing protein [Pyrinomonadaceae bacterium]